MAGSLAARAALGHRADHSTHRGSAVARGRRTANRRRAAVMCGIVGYTGKRTAAPVVLEGLKRLVHRGYDSGGLAVVNGGLVIFRAAAKLALLERELRGQ